MQTDQTHPVMFVNWREYQRVRLRPEDGAADFETFAARHVSGRIHEVRTETVDGFTDVTIEYAPIATVDCADCVQEGAAVIELATERLEDGTLLCAMHDHYRRMLTRGRGIDFRDDPRYWAGWFARMRTPER